MSSFTQSTNSESAHTEISHSWEVMQTLTRGFIMEGKFMFLHGHKDLSKEKNKFIFKMVQTYINTSERFSSSSLQWGEMGLAGRQTAPLFFW